MSSTVITGIAELVTCDGTGADLLGIRHEAAVVVEDDLIAWIGSAAGAPAADTAIDVGKRAIIPGFVDSHSHLVFAGDRGSEFAARMTGQPYDGGGIGVTVAATRASTDEELLVNFDLLPLPPVDSSSSPPQAARPKAKTPTRQLRTASQRTRTVSLLMESLQPRAS